MMAWREDSSPVFAREKTIRDGRNKWRILPERIAWRAAMTIDERIERLDLSLFGHIVSQTTEDDRGSFLAVQTVIRRNFPGYAYLEIGSHRGGSLQPHVVDPKCGRIISVDPRPASQNDSRGQRFRYPENNTQNMLDGLKRIPGADISKIRTFETTTAGLTGEMIGVRPHLCFVDGEHTDRAVVGDARFCLSVLAENGAILFHDANVIYGGLQIWLEELRASGRVFRAAVVPGSIFVVDFGSAGYLETEPLRGRVREHYKAYLFGMQENDLYRRAYPFSVARLVKKGRDIRWDLRQGLLGKLGQRLDESKSSET
jgi:hypothetical protein